MDTIPPQTQPAHTIPPPRTMHWMHEIRQYGAAFLGAALPLTVAFVAYVAYQRGLLDFRTVNRAFADVGAVLLGIVLLLGPMSRYFAFPDRYLQYRKELGIFGFIFALAHSVITLFVLPGTVSFAVVTAMLSMPIIFGLAGTVVLTLLFAISNEYAAEAIGRRLWWRMQNWGVRFIFAFVFIHVYLLKWSGWMNWYKTGVARGSVHPELPPLGILVGAFMTFVVLLRVAEFVGPRFFRAVWYVSIVALPVVYVGTFLWGMQFAK